MLAYTEDGAGPTVVLLHGLAGTGQQHFGALISFLHQSYRVIVPDLRGHGASQNLHLPEPERWFEQHVADVGELIEKLQLDSVQLIGYSDGAEIALLVAAHDPKRVASVTVWGISGRIPPLPVVHVYAEPEQRIPNWPSFRNELLSLHGAGGPQILSVWAQAMQHLHTQGGSILGAEADDIECPVLILSGDRDPFNPLVNVQILAERLPTSDMIILAGAAHDLLAERPNELQTLIGRMLHRMTNEQ